MEESRAPSAEAISVTISGSWSLIFLAALALVASSCRMTVEVPIEDLGRLCREVHARTILLDDHYTLISPYDLDATREFSPLVGEELAAVSALFEVEFTEPPTLWMKTVEDVKPQAVGEGESIDLIQTFGHDRHGVLAKAGGSLAIVYVGRGAELHTNDGHTLFMMRGAQDYRAIVRHEFAHLCASRAGLEGEMWFAEGLAQEVESMELRDGRLVASLPWTKLSSVAQLPRAERSLPNVLDLSYDADRVERGREAIDVRSYALSQAFMQFLLDRQGEKPFRRKLEVIRSISRTDLLSLEPEWQAWLDGLIGRG